MSLCKTSFHNKVTLDDLFSFESVVFCFNVDVLHTGTSARKDGNGLIKGN